MNNSWAVVEFVNSREVEVVPEKWVMSQQNGGNLECWFPCKKLNVSYLVSKCAEVGEAGLWDTYEVRILGSNYLSLEVARKKLKVAEETSDLDSEPRKKRKIISKSLFSPSPTKKRNVGRKGTFGSPTTTSESENEDLLSVPNFELIVNKSNPNSSRIQTNSENHIEPQAVGLQPKEVTPSSSTQNTGLDNAWKAGVTRTLHYLKLRVDAILEKLDEVVDIVHHLPQTSNKTSDDVIDDEFNEQSGDPLSSTTFPLNSLEELNKVESELCNKVAFDKLVKKTSSIGGVNTKETTKRILRFLINDELAMLFSYHGFKGKRVFTDLKIKEVVFKSVRHSKNSRESTDSEIESVIKDWLRHAKFRFQNKKSKETTLEIAE